MSKTAAQFFTDEQKDDIKQAILNAELDTSGEIRIHVENNCPGDVLDRSAYLFEKLGMKKTALRNGVLIYLALSHRKFAIIGDTGINAVVPENFWDSIKDNMLKNFREAQFAEGIIYAITKSGEQLKKYFPHQQDDVNELSDEISYGNN
ncbi:MAG: TPM domain-containing protein [Bacteroidetes bacterium]|nr:TPM domain-containing protein [Bacteroidota bacterium]